MKYLPLFAAALLLTPTLEAGSSKCCKVRKCNPCGNSCTRWYKAKDGTYREMIPYREALSRAEDADDMEIELRGVREELAAAQEAAAAEKSALDAELASLRKQLEEQVAATAAEKTRADSAEAAHKEAATQVAQLQESQQKAEAAAADLQKQLGEAVAARDNLQKQVGDLQAKVASGDQEIQRLKQEAVENKKVAVATEDYDADPPKDEDGEEAPAEEGGEEETEEPAAE